MSASTFTIATALAGLAFSAGTAPVYADRMEPLPKELEAVGVNEKLGDYVPLGLTFKDQDGKPTSLKEIVKGDIPVILTLNYSNCPMLCSLELNGLVSTLIDMKWTAGKEFRLVTVSIDPEETSITAKKKRQDYLGTYGRAVDPSAWTFLTGKAEDIKTLAAKVGFGYRFITERKEFAHSAVIMLLAPDGKISRYLYGVSFNPQDLKLGLLEASQGKVGSTVDKILLYCYHYDAAAGKYSLVASNIMKAGGVLMVGILGLFLGTFWLSEHRKQPSLS